MADHHQTVYLSGSINGHATWHLATGWRLYATEILEAADFTVLNPLRKWKTTDPDCVTVVNRDLQDIAQSDILLVEMDYEIMPYIGTAMEIRYAWEREKTIILWGTANQDSHWLNYHASRWFDTLDDALEYLCALKEAL